MSQLRAPKCQWPECGKEMLLVNETDDFYFFACGCGCTRAVSKPSTRARSHYLKSQSDAAEIKRRQRNRIVYSFPTGAYHGRSN